MMWNVNKNQTYIGYTADQGGAQPFQVNGGAYFNGSINLAAGSSYNINGVSIASPFSTKFTSTAQSVPGNANYITVAHGLGAVPFGIRVTLKNVTAELGYSPGQEVELTSNNAISGGTGSETSCASDATNVYVSLSSGSGIIITQLGGGPPSVITTAKWSIIVRAWL